MHGAVGSRESHLTADRLGLSGMRVSVGGVGTISVGGVFAQKVKGQWGGRVANSSRRRVFHGESNTAAVAGRAWTKKKRHQFEDQRCHL